jgi:hypothetical protein
METVVGLFDTISEAENAVRALEDAGIPYNHISLVTNDTDGRASQYYTGAASAGEDAGAVIASDATAGAALGGAAGLVMALTGMVIPGFGAVVAAGWLASTLAGAALGAATGGLVGALTGAGLPLEDAIYYKEGLHRGGTLVAVRTEEEMAPRVTRILREAGAVESDLTTESHPTA